MRRLNHKISMALQCSVFIAAVLGVGYSVRITFFHNQSKAQHTPAIHKQVATTVENTFRPNDKHIIELVNEYRAKAGVAPLQESPELMNSAYQKCMQMVQDHYFDHYDKNGNNPGLDAMERALPDHGYFAENLVAVSDLRSDNQPVDEWYEDKYVPDLGHRINMLNTKYTLTGVAHCANDPTSGTWMFVEHFAD